jgi:phosphomannomutase
MREEFPKAERELIDGLTVRLQDWWFNLRQHGEAAELLLNVEGRTEREQRRGRQSVERLVAKYASGS